MTRLVEITPSNRKGKKWDAIFERDGKRFTVSFGAEGYEDYTQHKDNKRRELYLKRHAKDLNTNDPTRAGYLSYYVLWGPSTSFAKNLEAYKKKFNIK